MNNILKNIKLIVLDVDGTLTNGKIYIDNNKVETKAFNVKDGIAIAKWTALGGKAAIITGRNSTITEYRGKELGIQLIRQGIKNKSLALKEILVQENIELSEVCYIGDDINDYGVMQGVGFSGCPSDACIEIREISHFISKEKGGNGAVREILEKIMKANGMWDKTLLSYLNEI